MDATEATIRVLEKGAYSHLFSPVSTLKGRTGGTYVCKELVYDYAMWINADFKIKVIQAFDRLQTQGVAVADHAAADLLENPLKYLEAIIGQAKELQARLQVVEPKAAVFDATVAVRKVTLGDFARRPT